MWTTDNTEGFTQAQLDDINVVLEFAMRHTELDPYNLNDIINNAWHDGITRDELLIAVSKRLAWHDGITRDELLIAVSKRLGIA